MTNPVGRPTSYNPEYCQVIEQLGADGLTVIELAVSLGVKKQTLYDWAALHPDFADAFTRAKESSEAFFTRTVRENLSNRDFNAKGAEFFGRAYHSMQAEALSAIPNWKEAKTLEEKCDKIIDAALDGAISHERGESLTRMICARAGLKLDDVEKRIELLNQKLESMK
jgi:hypothetical protein